MSLLRYNWSDFEDSFMNLNMLRNSLWSDFNKLLQQPTEEANKIIPTKIKLNMHETSTQYTYELEIPGINKENISILEENGVITITGKKNMTFEENKDGYHFIESRYGSFSRTITAPNNVILNSLTAKFNNGILTLTLNKNIDNTSGSRQVLIN